MPDVNPETFPESLVEFADDLAKLIVLAIILPLLTVAAMGAAEWMRGF